MDNLKRFTQFLETVDLAKYRGQFLPVKIVEMDLPKDIQAIKLLYEVYWDSKNFMSFDDFYVKYLDKKKVMLENFRTKIRMCEKCFYLGLPARIYRTWASLITQIHAGYVAEAVFGQEIVTMSEQLDHQGADFQVNYKNRTLNYQVKKKTESREVRKAKITRNILPGEFIDLIYEVPSADYFTEPKKRNGELKVPYKRFIENKNLKRLNNGFVIFTQEAFIHKKSEIDSE